MLSLPNLSVVEINACLRSFKISGITEHSVCIRLCGLYDNGNLSCLKTNNRNTFVRIFEQCIHISPYVMIPAVSGD